MFRIIWEVAKTQMYPFHRTIGDVAAGLRLIIGAPKNLKHIVFFVRRLWRHSSTTSDRWYRCQTCRRLWHVDFVGALYGLPDDGNARRTTGWCRYCRTKIIKQ